MLKGRRRPARHHQPAQPTGPETYVLVDTPIGKLMARVPGKVHQAVGDTVRLHWSANDAHLFDAKSERRGAEFRGERARRRQLTPLSIRQYRIPMLDNIDTWPRASRRPTHAGRCAPSTRSPRPSASGTWPRRHNASRDAGVMVSVTRRGGLGHAATADLSEAGLADAFARAARMAMPWPAAWCSCPRSCPRPMPRLLLTAR